LLLRQLTTSPLPKRKKMSHSQKWDRARRKECLNSIATHAADLKLVQVLASFRLLLYH